MAATSVTYLTLNGGAGNDSIHDNYSPEVLCGIGGGQRLTVTAYGAAGDDGIHGTLSPNCSSVWETFYGGPGGDTLEGAGRTVAVHGERGQNWVIEASSSGDATDLSCTLYGDDDHDVVESGSDLGTIMYGGDGIDMMYGYTGADEMHGQAGNDEMSGDDAATTPTRSAAGPGRATCSGEAQETMCWMTAGVADTPGAKAGPTPVTTPRRCHPVPLVTQRRS